MDYKDFTVVLPTLNEEKNIGLLINTLTKKYNGISLLIVDDGSKDGTKSVVQKILKKNSAVRFIDRAAQHKDKGLTASAVDGILAAKTEFVIVMDADLQHPISVIKNMSQKLKSNDLVVAIRADVEGWELYRKIISKVLIILGYFLLVISGKTRCNDIFSGFFGVNRKVFVEAYKSNRSRFVGGGYKILFDFLKCTDNGSIKIDEVPYSFGLRKYGASKAGFRQGMLLFRSFFT